MSDIIKYGIGFDYLPDWSIQEALREIYQNFVDYGEYEKYLIKLDDWNSQLTLASSYLPSGLEFLRVGNSGKRNCDSTIGEHGEGLKMALLVLHREQCKVVIHTGEYKLEPTEYDNDDLGKCFGIKKTCLCSPGFSIEVTAPTEELEQYAEKQLTEEDVKFDCYNGQLLNKKSGDIYVGGIFVTNLPSMNFAYNFKPEDVSLDRDRKVPSDYSVTYHAGLILGDYDKLTLDDFSGRDVTKLSDAPAKIKKQFKPVMKDKEVFFETKTGVRAPKNLCERLKRDPQNQKEIKKLRYKMTRKRKPFTILKEWYEKNKGHIYNSDAEIDFENILDRARDW